MAGTYTPNTDANPPTLTGLLNFNGVVSPTGVAVFRLDSLTVKTGAAINLTGGYGKWPVAHLASGNLTFGGTINAAGTNGGNPSATNGGIGGPAGTGSGGVGWSGGGGGVPPRSAG